MRQDVVDLARSWIGTPYLHQGARRGVGTDCLGLLLGVWRELYGNLPFKVPPYGIGWDAPDQSERLWGAACTYLEPKDLGDGSVGDVLLFRMRQAGPARHLGIDTGEGTFVHAYSRHAVLESGLSTPWARRIVARFTFPDLAKD